ncbi:hypothetical protein RFI_39314, partial [Reticulomyxa filosa]
RRKRRKRKIYTAGDIEAGTTLQKDENVTNFDFMAYDNFGGKTILDVYFKCLEASEHASSDSVFAANKEQQSSKKNTGAEAREREKDEREQNYTIVTYRHNLRQLLIPLFEKKGVVNPIHIIVMVNHKQNILRLENIQTKRHQPIIENIPALYGFCFEHLLTNATSDRNHDQL